MVYDRAVQQVTLGPDAAPTYIYVALKGIKLHLSFTHELEWKTTF